MSYLLVSVKWATPTRRREADSGASYPSAEVFRSASLGVSVCSFRPASPSSVSNRRDLPNFTNEIRRCHFFCFPVEDVRRNGGLVHVEERDVIAGYFAKQNDELHKALGSTAAASWVGHHQYCAGQRLHRQAVLHCACPHGRGHYFRHTVLARPGNFSRRVCRGPQALRLRAAGHLAQTCANSVHSERASYGFDIRSACPVAKSTGNETCSCTISHLPLILRNTSVTRATSSFFEPSLPVNVVSSMWCA